MYILVGLLGLVALGAVIVLGMRVVERLTARWVGVPRFRWFDVETTAWWRLLIVRLASALVPFVVSVAMFFVAYVGEGQYLSSSSSRGPQAVEVFPGGAAQEAGLRDGDQVVSVAGVAVHTWDEMRASIAARSGPTPITILRSGARLELSVTPRGGLIGVVAKMVRKPVSLGEALLLAARLPPSILAESAKAIVAAHDREGKDVMGPVGIVRETGKAHTRGWFQLVYFLGLLCGHWWPFVAGAHLFDAVTGWTFRMTFARSVDFPERLVRIARLRFTVYASLACFVAAILCELAMGVVPGAMVLLFLAIPGLWTLPPLMWVSYRELSDDTVPRVLLLPLLLVPCVAQLFAIELSVRLTREERRLRTHVAVAG